MYIFKRNQKYPNLRLDIEYCFKKYAKTKLIAHF